MIDMAMPKTLTLPSRHQSAIPVALRERMGLKTGQKRCITMFRTGFMLPAILLLVLSMTGCARLQKNPASQKQSIHHRNEVLSQGYALLYKKAQELADIHQLLRIKAQSKETARVIDDISEYGAKLSKLLENLVKRYPSLSLKDTGLPEVERKKRAALMQHYLKKM